MTKLDRLLKAYEGDAHRLPAELERKPFTTFEQLDRDCRRIRACGRETSLAVYALTPINLTKH